jgi:hypothetical protein
MKLPSLRDDYGQSSVELVALLPLVFVVGLAILAVLSARSASGQAAAAAQAGAMALIQDTDAGDAARDALPAAARGRSKIEVDGRRITVTVHPLAKPAFVGAALAATVSANAGPQGGR